MSLVDKCVGKHYLNIIFSKNYFSDVEDTKVVVGLPYPIHEPFKTATHDIVKSNQTKYKKYQKKAKYAKNHFDSIKNQIMCQNFKDSKYVQLTKGLLEFYDVEEPSLPFNCDYNPYYGGFLDTFHLNGSDYLIRPDTDNNLRITNLVTPLETTSLNLVNALTSPIFSLSTTRSSSGILLNVRQKDAVNLYSISTLHQPIPTKWSKQFNKPLLDSAVNQFDTEKLQLAVVTNDLNFNIIDVNRNKTLVNTNRTGFDSIHRLNYLDVNLLALMSHKNLKILDFRSFNHNLFQPNLSDCDTFCNFQFVNNLMYIISRHFITMTDLRFLKSVEYCSHLSKSSPCFVDVGQTNSTTLMCLSSQNVDEDKILLTGNPISSLPIKVPSIQHTLEMCKLRRDCLLKVELDNRLNYSIAGMKIVCDQSSAVLYSSNCLGELFAQIIPKNDSNDDDDDVSIETLYKWIERLTSEEKAILYPIDVVNLGNVHHALNYPILNTENQPKYKGTKFLEDFTSKYSTQNLGQLAGSFAAIWDDLDEVVKETEKVDDYVTEIAPIDKVNSWIQSNYFNENSNEYM